MSPMNNRLFRCKAIQLAFIMKVSVLAGCAVNYPTTTFYVKNTSDKTINFKASVMKHSSMGPFEITLPFAVPPRDSIVARQVGFRRDAVPTAWFTQFIIFPVDSVSVNDPNEAGNWVRSTGQNGKPVYTFTIAK